MALGTIVIAWAGSHAGWVLIGVDAALALVAVLDALRAPSPAAVGVAREMPATLVLGASGDIAWRVTNPRSRAASIGVADDLAPSLRAGTRRVTGRVPGRATVTMRTTIEPSRRGRFEPRELVVRTSGPLGLATRQKRRQLPGQLRVLPPFGSRKEAELRIERARILEVGLRSAQGRGGGTEFENLREYSVDDEFRRIDWSATARTGKAIVRTYRAERNQTVLVLLDAGRVMAGRVEGVPRLEHAIDATLMLTAVATRLGDRAGLVAFDRQVRAIVPPGHTKAQIGRVTDALFDLEPQLFESDYRGAFAETLTRWRRRALLIVLTELMQEAVPETLLPALPLLAGRHLVVVASVTDPEVVRWAEAVPTEASTSYRKAAAIAGLERRAQTAWMLRSVGATVVDASPGTLAGRLADTYLRVKATGRL